MEAFEKQCRDAFEDYRLPVSETAWQKVLAGQQPRRIGYLPLLRVAAALALLVFCWFAYQTLMPVQDPSSGQQLPIAVHEQEDAMDPITEPQPIGESHEFAAGSLDHSMVPAEKPASSADRHNHKVRAYATAPATCISGNGPDSDSAHGTEQHTLIALDQDDRQEWPLQLLPNLKYELLPREYGTLPLVQTQKDFAQTQTESRPQLRRLTNDDRTGPERLLATLDRYKPRFVDDLVSLATRPTEIEINW